MIVHWSNLLQSVLASLYARLLRPGTRYVWTSPAFVTAQMIAPGVRTNSPVVRISNSLVLISTTQLYLLEHNGESFNVWSASIGINTACYVKMLWVPA